jgi:hypothetical protein
MPRFLGLFISRLSSLSVGLGLLVAIAGCEGSPLGSSLQRTLEADPQLAETGNAASGPGDTATPSAPDRSSESAPEPGQADFIGPVYSAAGTTPPPSTPAPQDTSASGRYEDLDQAPEDLQAYLQDLIALDILKISPPAASATPGSASTPQTQASATASTANQFKPNQTITRREFARWLLAVNNRFYADQTARKIRLAVGSSAPVFKDVAASDPDFGAIQGLAEAGIIPSPLTGSSTVVNFRPEAPLTRKDLILWKVPLDTREALPNATVDAVQQAWGFQDAAKIQPPALQAVLADHQIGEFANILRAFGYTTLFQPDKGVTRAEAVAALWRFGSVTEGITAEEVLTGQVSSPEAEAGTTEEGDG